MRIGNQQRRYSTASLFHSLIPSFRFAFGAILAAGTMLALVACSDPGGDSTSPTGVLYQWTWEGGSNTADSQGVYGILGTAAPGNVPGARGRAVGWQDSSGNFWLFGGLGEDSVPANGSLNDLWQFNPVTGKWTWEGGANTVNASGSYTMLGAPYPGNLPGARYGATSWKDANGNFWLFGGYGYDSTGANGYLNDLWEYDPSTGYWAWQSGSSSVGAQGSYGTLGQVGTGNNVPGARDDATTWMDGSGNFWLFGGYGEDSSGTFGALNDLWQFNPTTKEWTWEGGSKTVNASGGYAQLGIPYPGNMPGARYGAAAWSDANGNLWLFGGYGDDSVGTPGYLNDLWEYNPTTYLWIWVGGSSTANASGVYGTQGQAAAGNSPGGRYGAVARVDFAGEVWIFGGYGTDSVGSKGDLNDMWMYQPINNTWTWKSGSDTIAAAGNYLAQVGQPGGNPGARESSVAWTDANDSFWIFGGDGFSASPGAGPLNDMWQFNTLGVAQ